ncbi:alcohol dehydrogenase catalytic domain-containing protein [Rhodococcus koreensis]
MRAARFDHHRISVAEVPSLPALSAHQVLIDVHSCGICGSDLSMWKDVDTFVDVACAGRFHMAAFDPNGLVVPGHEFTGTVREVGFEVSEFKIGDRVTGIGVATESQSGEPTIIGCSNLYTGGFAQQIVVDSSWVRHVPASLSLDAATLAEPLHVGEMHVQQSDYKDGDVGLVIGAGTIGLGVVIALRERGCDTIVVVEPAPRRRELASMLGAHLVASGTGDSPADALPSDIRGRVIAYECSGRHRMLDSLIRTLPYGSHIQLVASPFRSDEITPVIGQWRGIVLNFGSGPFDDPYGITLQRLADGIIDPDLFITGHVGLDGVAEAFETLLNPNEHVKILVHPNGHPK